MAFEGLSERLEAAFKRLKSKGSLNEADVRAAMRDVRMALLEADVSYKVAKDFTAKVTERAIGADVMESLTPAQMVIKIVNEELIDLMGGTKTRLATAAHPPTVIMLCGLQGAGKTTHCAKLALMLKNRGSRPMLVACDIYRPAAIKQLQVLGEKVGVPVLVERSSYESDPLARMEWVKLYGILLGRTEEAERIFDDAVQRIAPLLDEKPTGKTAAFFSITSNNLATVRKGGDYVAKMIGLAGGSYVFADLTDSGNNLATVNISLEDFYAGARDADVLFYNSTIEGELRTMDELLAKCPMLADFKAVQSGSVWCTSQSLFQQSMELPELILDMNRVFTEDDPDDSELTFLTKLH